MIPVFIDTTSLSESFSLSQEQTRNLIDFTIKNLTADFARKWEQTAAAGLTSARNLYLRNIIVIDEGFAKGSVVLVGQLPNDIESGKGPYDMKPGFLSGPNAKPSSTGGMYNTIPFRISAPGSLAESEVFSGSLPQEVYDIIQSKPQDVPVAGGGRKTAGLKVAEIPKPFNQATVRSAPRMVSQKFSDYQRKTSIYAGVSKVQDPVTKQNRYQSFRRVSDKSDPSSWIHPGFDAANFADKALQELDIESITGKAIDSFLINNGLI